MSRFRCSSAGINWVPATSDSMKAAPMMDPCVSKETMSRTPVFWPRGLDDRFFDFARINGSASAEPRGRRGPNP